MKVKQLIKIVEDEGWVLRAIKGDHRVYTKPGAKRPIVIPGNLSRDIPIGTEKSVLRTIRGG